jgi:hypothetical protein
LQRAIFSLAPKNIMLLYRYKRFRLRQKPKPQEKLEVRKMREVRHNGKRLMAMYDEENGRIEIKLKDCVTTVIFPPGTKIEFVHTEEQRQK